MRLWSSDRPPDLPIAKQSRARRAASLALKISITAALVGILANKTDLASMTARIARIDIRWMMMVFALIALQLVLSGIRWSLITRRLDVGLPSGLAIRLIFIGHAFSQALPSGIGGDAVRAWLAARRTGKPGKALSSVISDRLIALLVLLLMASAGQALFVPSPDAAIVMGPVRLAIWSLTILAIIGVVAGPWMLLPLRRFRVGSALRSLGVDIQRCLGAPWNTVAAVAILSLAAHFAIIVSTWCVARSLALPLTLSACLVMMPPILVTAVLPISVGGWGVREGAMVVGLGLVGIPADGALALSLLFGVANLAMGVPGLLLWLVVRNESVAGLPSDPQAPPSAMAKGFRPQPTSIQSDDNAPSLPSSPQNASGS